MANLTAAQIAAMSDFDAATIVSFTADLGNSQAVDVRSTAGALDLTRERTEFTGTGALAMTLAAPTTVNQRKRITCISGAAPANTLTITSPDDTAGFVCPATFFFDTAGQEIELIATSALKWRCVGGKRTGGLVDNVVVGTTVLSSNPLWLRFNCSVTGTASSTATKALPNGSWVGERIWITNTTAATTPVGSIDGTFTAGLVTAYTHLGAIGVVASATAVGDSAMLTWTGSAWDCVYQSGVTFS